MEQLNIRKEGNVTYLEIIENLEHRSVQTIDGLVSTKKMLEMQLTKIERYIKKFRDEGLI